RVVHRPAHHPRPGNLRLPARASELARPWHLALKPRPVRVSSSPRATTAALFPDGISVGATLGAEEIVRRKSPSSTMCAPMSVGVLQRGASPQPPTQYANAPAPDHSHQSTGKHCGSTPPLALGRLPPH